MLFYEILGLHPPSPDGVPGKKYFFKKIKKNLHSIFSCYNFDRSFSHKFYDLIFCLIFY